jgi:hypothetical protein
MAQQYNVLDEMMASMQVAPEKTIYPYAKIPLSGKGIFILKDWDNIQDLANYLELNEGQVNMEVAYSFNKNGKPIFTLSKHPLAKLKED